MRLLRLTIENFRGFRNETVRLGGHAAFVGENNAGKSTILEAIRRPLDPDPPFQEVTEFDFPSCDFRNERISIEVVVGDLGNQAPAFQDHWEAWRVDQYDFEPPVDDPQIFERDGIDKVVRFGYRAWWDNDEERLREQRFYPVSSSRDDWEQAEMAPAKDRRRVPFFSVPFPRDARRLLDLTRRSSLSRLLTARKVNVQPQVLAVRQKLRELGPLMRANDTFASILDELAEIISGFMPLANASALSIEPLADGETELLRAFQAVVHLATDATPLPLASHGGGMRNAATAAALLCLAATRGEFILAFEEPEVSLHPALQRHFVGRLRDDASQLLVSTHSPDVSQRFELSELRLVRVSGGRGVVSPQFTDPVELKHAMHWSSKIAPALFASATVLVEGMSDQVAYSAFAAWHHNADPKARDFDARNWALVSIDGKSGVPLARVMSRFGLPLIAIVDGDQPGTQYANQLKADGIAVIQLPPSLTLEDLMTVEASREVLVAFAADADAFGYTELREAGPETLALDELRTKTRQMLARGKDRGSALFRALADCYGTDVPPLAVALLNAVYTATPGVGSITRLVH